jgi:hypothetical protein
MHPSVKALVPQRISLLPPLRLRLRGLIELDRQITEGLAELEARHARRKPSLSFDRRRKAVR